MHCLHVSYVHLLQFCMLFSGSVKEEGVGQEGALQSKRKVIRHHIGTPGSKTVLLVTYSSSGIIQCSLHIQLGIIRMHRFCVCYTVYQQSDSIIINKKLLP